jgi:hypothetical protein
MKRTSSSNDLKADTTKRARTSSEEEQGLIQTSSSKDDDWAGKKQFSGCAELVAREEAGPAVEEAGPAAPPHSPAPRQPPTKQWATRCYSFVGSARWEMVATSS